MNRRELMNLVSVGTLAASLPVAIASCTDDTEESESSAPDTNTPDTEPVPRADGFAEIGTVAELEEVGFLANIRFQGSRVIVTRDPANANALIAVNAICPHAACTVVWNETTFDCPCHESIFNLDGTVASGPAVEPLGIFEVKIEGDRVFVKV